jgi:hypothetical protein
MLTFAAAAVVALMARSLAPFALAMLIRPVMFACNAAGCLTGMVRDAVVAFIAA